MKILRVSALAVALFAAATTLTGCTATVPLEPGALANDPNCAVITVRLPDTVAELPKRTTNAQATGAWGNPTAVILRCGLQPVEASTLPCVTAGGVDWLVDQSQAPNYRFISFARNPATEVIVNSEKVSGSTVLDELGPAVSVIPASKKCLG